jgi:hypothetical protein
VRDNIVILGPRLQARSEHAAQNQFEVERSRTCFRVIAHAVRGVRGMGASTKEVVHTLRMIADELKR